MRKKFTMLLASLLACMGAMKADVTDLPQMSTDGDIKWYTIKNTRSGRYANYAGDAVQMTQTTGVSLSSLFYFTASEEETAEGFTPVMIHNAKATNLLADFSSWTEAGKTWFLSVDAQNKTATGLHITTSAAVGEWNSHAGWNALNDANSNNITNYCAIDAGSIFVIESVEAAQLQDLVSAYKDAAKTELENWASVPVLYPSATTAIEKVEAVEVEYNEVAIIENELAIIVSEYKQAAYQALEGKYFTINTPARANNGYMQMAGTKVIGVASASTPADVWQFVYNNGAVNVYNPYTGKYLCEPTDENSKTVPVTTDQANAGAYDLIVYAKAEKADAKIKFTSNGKSVHMDGSANLVKWNDGGASEWIVTEVTDFTTIVNAYKASAITTLDSWATLSVVSDAELIAAAKTAIEAINTTDWATFAAIDAELKNVTDKEAGKYFTFKNDDTKTAARVDAYLAANSNTSKGYGTKTFDYSAIWKLLNAGGTSFYLYNELNNVYLKNPSSGDLVADASQAATYTFEIIDAATNKAELKGDNETLHLNNSCGLINYDENDPASRWYITSYSFKDGQVAALAALETAYNAKAYATDAEVGEGLGQYQGDKDAIVTALNAGKAILDKSLVEQAALDVDAINSATENLNNASDLTLNMPVQGKYYRIKSVNSNNYVTAPANTGTAMTLIADASANNILYWDAEGHLLVYGTGYYINGKNHAHLGYKDTYAVEGSKTGVIGAYTIKPSNANYWYDNGASLDVYQGATHANCNWTIEEVTTLPVTITEAGYATFYAPVEVTLPDGVTAHTVTANGEWATLSEAISVVPAENGVILAGEADIYNFTITNTGAADLENALAGTVAKTLVAKTEGDAYYVLAKKDENVGLYNPVKGDDEANFYNASHKAYWHIPAAPQSAGYRFGEGTTSVDNVQLTNDNVVIYDLAGRRVEKMEKGIYIVNGKKVIR